MALFQPACAAPTRRSIVLPIIPLRPQTIALTAGRRRLLGRPLHCRSALIFASTACFLAVCLMPPGPGSDAEDKSGRRGKRVMLQVVTTIWWWCRGVVPQPPHCEAARLSLVLFTPNSDAHTGAQLWEIRHALRSAARPDGAVSAAAAASAAAAKASSRENCRLCARTTT